MTYDLEPGQADYLATAIEVGNNSLAPQSPADLVAEIAKAIRDCPNGARIVVEAVTGNRSEMVERVRDAIRKALADELNGKPNGCIVTKGCEAARYVDPEGAAEDFINLAADKAIAALSSQAQSDDVVEREVERQVELFDDVGLRVTEAAKDFARQVGKELLAAIPSAGGEIGDCELCNKPLLLGQFVNVYEDIGTAHANCEAPFAKPTAPTPSPDDDGTTMPTFVLLGSPALLEKLA